MIWGKILLKGPVAFRNFNWLQATKLNLRILHFVRNTSTDRDKSAIVRDKSSKILRKFGRRHINHN
jgi:hypothetical protein